MSASEAPHTESTVAPTPAGRTVSAGRALADGAMRGFAAEALILPTGLVTASVLARVLGPGGYGHFALVSAIAGWVTSSSVALLGRAAIKVISESVDWSGTAAAILRLRAKIGALAALALLASAWPIGRILDLPALTPLLAVMALDIVMFNLTRAYRETLTGIGRYRDLAQVSAMRWLVRMLLIVGLVLWLQSVMAAVVASVLTSLIEFAVASRLVAIPWSRVRALPLPDLWRTAAPLMLFGLAFQLHSRADLFAVTALQRGVSTATRDAGLYGAAQNLSVIPGLFMMTVAPLLLATLGRRLREGDRYDAERVAATTMRTTIALLPAMAIVATSALPIIRLIYGEAFDDAAPALALLFASGLCMCVTVVCTSMLTATNHTRTVSLLGVLLLSIALVGHAVMVPRYGARGAALVTLASSACTSVVALWHTSRIWPLNAVRSLAKAVVVAAVLAAGGVLLGAAVWWGLLLKLSLLSAIGALGAWWIVGTSARDDSAQVPRMSH